MDSRTADGAGTSFAEQGFAHLVMLLHRALQPVFLFALMLSAGMTSKSAYADGALLAPQGFSVQIDALRMAVAQGAQRQTLWAQVRFSSSATRVLWVVPAESGVGLDVDTSSWLDALDAASAAQVEPPPSKPPTHDCTNPQVDSIAEGDYPAIAPLLRAQLITREQLAMALGSLGYAVPAATSSWQSPAFLLLELGASSQAATLTLRWNGSQRLTLPPLDLAASDGSSMSTQLFALGDTRATLATATEGYIPMGTIRWTSATTDTYREQRTSLLQNFGGQGFVLESASLLTLTHGLTTVTGSSVDSALWAYATRASSRGETSANLSSWLAELSQGPLLQSLQEDPCPRGDLVADPTCPRSAPPSLALDTRSDDLAFALRCRVFDPHVQAAPTYGIAQSALLVRSQHRERDRGGSDGS